MLGTEFGANMIPVVSRPQGIGKVFYVNHFTGNNANNGVDPGTPFNDITYALMQCVNDRNDYIIVLDCWNDEPAFPIVIAKSRVHIIGLAFGTMVPMLYPIITGGGAASVFRLGANYIEIAGFGMGSAGGACIDLLASFGGHWIHHCTFGKTVACQDGILAAIADAPSFSMIEDCTFDQAITRDGIRCLAPTFSIIRNNIFRELAGGIGINITGPGEITAIIGNYFYAPIALGLAAGWAITLSSSGALVMGNRASQTGDATGASPYVDLTGGGVATRLNGWCDNWEGAGAVDPT